MSAFEHTSVLLNEVLDHLAPRDHGVYVDGTLGGAGHAEAVLERCPTARLIGIDRDPAALEAAKRRLGDRATVVHGAYADLASILAELNIDQVDGILLDLGVSSPQLDRAERGFSFTKDGPLDMRMDPTRGRTAFELIRQTDGDTLAEILLELGEERHGRKIARMIKETEPRTTTELAALCARAIPMVEQRKSKIHPATRTFQGLRIAVNAELAQLEQLLDDFPDLLAPGGRCAIISFHSLEDRPVKNRFRDLTWTSSLPPKLAREAGERVEPVCELITRKAVFASEAEIAANPRSRSARLRVCERTTAPNVAATR
ncbi:MAG: 16S rRNA (cytosine(1402)-N(4))-methyltransferase RsmH [Kofleriaceae bacterium]